MRWAPLVGSAGLLALGAAADAHRCPQCGYVEINSDELFKPPRDGFDPPRVGGFDAPGETGS